MAGITVWGLIILIKLVEELERDGTMVMLSHVNQPALDMARKFELSDSFIEERIFPNVDVGVQYYLERQSPAPQQYAASGSQERDI